MANIFNWNVTSGNFGASASWSPVGTPTSADTADIDSTTLLFGSGSANILNIYDDCTVTISAALTTTIASYVAIGSSSGVATVDVDAGWTNSSGITVGNNPSDNAAVNVNAQGSLNTVSLSIGTAYNAGPGGTGALTVSGGGGVKTTGTWDNVGDWQGSTGTLTVEGFGSSWTSGGTLNIGDNGAGTLYVETFATLNAVQLNTGVSYDQPSVASGSGNTFIESGGVVTTTGAYQEIGNGATGASGDAIEGATGAVTITGAGSKWIATNGAIEVSDAGSKTGSLTISDGGNLTATNEIDVGNEYLGYDGSYGTLLIESGGTAVTGGFHNGNGVNYDTVGGLNAAAAASTATVTGSGSSWKMNDSTLAIQYNSEVSVAAGGAIDAATGLLMYTGSVLQVDYSSTFEDGSVGGAALGYLTVDPVANGNNGVFAFGGTIDADVVDNGLIYAGDGGVVTLQGPNGAADTGTLSGTGVLQIGSQAALYLSLASVASPLQVSFVGFGGTLGIESTGFSAAIDNFAAGDIIDIEGLAFVGGGSSNYVFTPSGTHDGGTLEIIEGSNQVTLDIGSSPLAISGALTLGKDTAGTGTAVKFTAGATQSPFSLWSTPGSLFNASSGPIDGLDYGLSSNTDGGAPIWVETATPSASYVAGSPDNYSIVLATQDFLGDVQPEITVATDSAIVDPFVNNVLATGNLGAAFMFSSNPSTGAGGIVYWTASSTKGDYAVDFEPLTVTYPSLPPASNFVTITGSPVTMFSAIASPIDWQVTTSTANSLVFAYTTPASSTTENLYMEAFNASGVATNAQPLLVANNLADGTPYRISYHNGSYGYQYLEVGTGLLSGNISSTSDDEVDIASVLLSLPSFTAFDGVYGSTESNNNVIRLVEGVVNGQAVIQSFMNSDATPVTTYDLTSASDHFGVANVYDVNDGALDYRVLAYTDAGKVHLDLLNENGVQIGADYIVPGISSFLTLHTIQAGYNPSSTRVELDYEAADPNGGQEIDSLIYDTDAVPYNVTLSGGGMFAGSPFDDTYTWGAGVYAIDGGGGVDTFSATNLSPAAISLTIDAAGETVINDDAGDIDTLRRFTTIDLSTATVTISGDSLTQLNTDGTKLVSTFNFVGQPYTTREIFYGSNGQIEYKLFTGVSGEGDLTSFKYLYAGNGFVGADNYYTGVTGQAYTSYEIDTDGAGRLMRLAYSGLSGTPYSSYEYDYVDFYSGSKFTYTSVPAGATYSSYEVDYDQTGALTAEKFFYTGVTGQFYKTEEVDYTFSGGQSELSRVVLSDISGEPYSKLEEDYTGGVYSSNKAYYQITGQAFSTEEVDSTAGGQLLRVVYSGFVGTPYSSIEQDYSAGQVSQTTYGFTNVTGDPYNAYQITESASGTTLTEIFDFDTGEHRQIAEAAGQTLTSLGNDKFSGSASGSTTFVLNPIYGADTITNLTSADSVDMSQADFTGFQQLFQSATPTSASVVTITAANGDSLTLDNMTMSTLSTLNNNFHFS